MEVWSNQWRRCERSLRKTMNAFFMCTCVFSVILTYNRRPVTQTYIDCLPSNRPGFHPNRRTRVRTYPKTAGSCDQSINTKSPTQRSVWRAHETHRLIAHWVVRFVHLVCEECVSATGRCAVWVEFLSVQRVITNNINYVARINRTGKIYVDLQPGGCHCNRSSYDGKKVNCSDIMSVCLHNQRRREEFPTPPPALCNDVCYHAWLWHSDDEEFSSFNSKLLFSKWVTAGRYCRLYSESSARSLLNVYKHLLHTVHPQGGSIRLCSKQDIKPKGIL